MKHLNRLEELYDDKNRFIAFTKLARSHKTWICPTLIIYKRKVEFAKKEFFTHALYNDLDNDIKNEWEQVKKVKQNKIFTEEEALLAEERYKKQKLLVRNFYDKGIPLLIGTDFAGIQFVYPGYSLHEEMDLLQSIGIPPFAILKMATLNPAIFLEFANLMGQSKRRKWRT
ncbi:MAG: hypothetical protein IPK25_14980 [Saprospiraceae bacterium]|nr:hypothetical protein [Saprospiraceae bacterium]